MGSKIYALIACLTLLFVVGWISYHEMNTSQVTVDVQLKQGEDPFKTLKSIIPADTSVVEVSEVNRGRNEYKMTVKTRQKPTRLLEWLRSSSRVERAEECSK